MALASHDSPNLVFVPFPELKLKYGIDYSRQHILRLEKAGRFPCRVRMGAKVVWIAHELREWQSSLIGLRTAPQAH